MKAKDLTPEMVQKRLKEEGAIEITLEEAEEVLIFINELVDSVLAIYFPHYKEYLNSKKYFSDYK